MCIRDRSYNVIARHGAATSSIVYNETLTALYRDWTSSLDLYSFVVGIIRGELFLGSYIG